MPGDASASMPDDVPAPGLYRHYKGGQYRVACVGRHSETEEWLVTYWCEATRDWWVRPLVLWNATVDGTPRFQPVAERPLSPA